MRTSAQTRIEPVLLGPPLAESRAENPRAQRAGPRPHRRGDAHARRSELPGVLLPLLAIAAVGYLLRDWKFIDPERGIGYGLGIAAGSMMLVVLLYPLRKRAGWLGRAGRVSGWFRLHMILGLVAPTLVLLHCNFQGGALNSNVALYALLTVAASGLVGRTLYSRVHRGLYGAKARAPDLLAEALEMRQRLDPGLASKAWEQLRAHEGRALELPRSTLGRVLHASRTRRKSRNLQKHLVKDCQTAIARAGRTQAWPRRQVRDNQRAAADAVSAYFRTVNRAASLAVFERLFALWHVLHVPLFIILIGTIIIHVIAVHLY